MTDFDKKERERNEAVHYPNGKWLGRSLDNYIAMHKGKYPEVTKAKTLTEARRICFGVKQRKG
jgi:hypothetical protein